MIFPNHPTPQMTDTPHIDDDLPEVPTAWVDPTTEKRRQRHEHVLAGRLQHARDVLDAEPATPTPTPIQDQ